MPASGRQQTEMAMREGRYFKTTQAKQYTVADLIKRYLVYVRAQAVALNV